MSRVFVTRRLPGNALKKLQATHAVAIWPEDRPPTRRELIDSLQGVDGLISLLTDQIDGEVFDACPDLKVVANLAVGFDNIDVGAATSRGIPIGNTPDVLTNATADYTFALLLAAARHVVRAHQSVQEGGWTTWDPMGFLGHPVYGARLLIVGFGRIGRAVAERTAGFKMTVDVVTSANSHDLHKLLPTADFVTLHCPLTSDSTHLIDGVALARMKRSAYLINTARGALVDTDALANALRNHEIAGAAIDVSDPEPLPLDHPLLRSPNLTITPHIASATHEAREAMAALSVENIIAGLAGQRLPNCVNPAVYGTV